MVDHPDPDRGTVHTPGEIAQQPEMWRQTARLVRDRAPALKRFLEAAGLYSDEIPSRILLTGAGTSHYVGLSVVDLLRRRFDTPCESRPTTRITPNPDLFFREGEPTLMVHFARSGNSPESRAVLEGGLECMGEAGRHLVITCNSDGTLAELARAHPDRVHLLVLPDDTNDQGLAMTSSYTSMVVASQALPHLDRMDAFVHQTDRTTGIGETVLAEHPDAVDALMSGDVRRAFFLGNNDLYGAATESALKVQELTAGQILAGAEDTLAFRHGPISAVDAHSLVVFYLSARSHTRRYELDVVRQYQDAFEELGASIAVVAPQRPEIEETDHLSVFAYDAEGAVPALQQTNVAVLIGQLAGLFAAYRRGVNVDEPSVEKALYNRTVQGVQIYDPSGACAENSGEHR
ncbi:tagatose-6-phosphate ketose/aldose isomerase [Salinibacter ruber]|uniref:SIS domain-containing protein n=1 Tax=Salinibacter ruber TaxID=146919 RepID=UPI002169B87D|nr:SIS domain-containing protein [Salinibacter ruber]MCS4113940.1 tagatose-6-phosphate ketose/aldose isomerase [Salinibacter ruber]